MSYNTFSPIIHDGLILYLDSFNTKSYSGSGTSSYDLIESRLGELKNGTIFINNYFSFDGVNDYIDFGNILDFDGLSPFSISVWCKTTYAGINQTSVVCKSIWYAPYTGWVFGFNVCTATLNDSGKFGFTFADTNNNVIRRQAVDICNDGKWYNFTLSYDGSQQRSGCEIYINGILTTMTDYNNTSINQTLSNASNLQIGARDGSNYTSPHSVSSVLVYNRVLTPNEVLTNYNALKNRFI